LPWFSCAPCSGPKKQALGRLYGTEHRRVKQKMAIMDSFSATPRRKCKGAQATTARCFPARAAGL
jgi:hypothetical protein